MCLIDTWDLVLEDFSLPIWMLPWSFAKFIDLLKHLPIPILVIGWAYIASVLRVMRGSLLDELKQAYVVAARAKGLEERKLLYKYPVSCHESYHQHNSLGVTRNCLEQLLLL